MEQMINLGEENKEIRIKLQIHDRELKKTTTTMEKLYDENKLLSKNMEKLYDENKLLSKKMEQMHDENKLLSKDNQFLSQAVFKIVAENKRLSAQVENLAKENEELTNTVTLQGKDISALQSHTNNNITEQSRGQPNDLVLEDFEDNISKRVLLHSETDILRLVTTHGTDIQKLKRDVANLKTDMPKEHVGSTFVRWGRNSCSANGTELVYSGYAAGSDFSDSGAAANYICLSPDPLWGYYNDADNARAKVMGVEYELDGAIPDMMAFFHKNIHEEDAPCSVCRSPRPTVIMIPGRNQCYKGWTLEYKGYLVTGYYGRTSASEYVCLDDYPQALPGGHANQNGKLFHMVEGRCGSLRCPPYVEGRELTCVVCSK